MAPQRTASALGGIIMARPPLPRMGPRLMDFLYPCASIEGARAEPNMATLARLVPVKVENRVPTATASKLSLPGNCPSHLSRAFIKVGAMPVWNITSPMRMKRGTGSKMNVFRLV